MGSRGDANKFLRSSPGIATLLISTFLTSATSGLMIPVVPLFLLSKGFDLFKLGAVASLVALSGFGTQRWMARYQRHIRNPILTLALMSFSALMYLGYLFAQNAVEFILISLATSIASNAARPGVQFLVASARSRERRSIAFGHMGVATSVSYAIGIIAGGALLSFGYWAVFLAGSLTAFSSLAVLLSSIFPTLLRPALDPRCVPRELEAPADRMLQSWGRVQRASSHLRRKAMDLAHLRPRPKTTMRNVRWVSIHLFFFAVPLAIYPFYFPIHLVRSGLPLPWVGFWIAASWLIYGAIQPWGGRIGARLDSPRAMIATCFVAAAILNVMMALGTLWVILLAWILLAIVDGLARPITGAIIGDIVRESSLGMAYASTGAVEALGAAAGPFLIGMFVRSTSIRMGLLVAAAMFLLAALPLTQLKRIREAASTAALRQGVPT